jgi:hypothetical protein
MEPALSLFWIVVCAVVAPLLAGLVLRSRSKSSLDVAGVARW